MKFKKILILLVACSILSSCNKNSNEHSINSFDEPTLKITSIDDLEIKKEADTYNLVYEENNIFVEASKTYSTSSFNCIEELSAINEENVTVLYNVEYDTENYKIYLENKFLSPDGQIYFEDKIQGDPVYYEDGTSDVVFFDNNRAIFLSSLTSEKESCWLFTCFLISTFVAAIIDAVVTACVVVICSVIIFGSVYQIVKVTEKIISDAKTRVEEERKKDTDNIYFPAVISGKGLGISQEPVDTFTAAAAMHCLNNFWTFDDNDAKIVCIIANLNGFPIQDPPHGIGYYAHYHPYNHNPDVHCWYGEPSQGVYN